MDGRAPARTPGRPCRQRTAGRWARAGLHALRGRSGSLGPARGTGKACTYGSGDGRLDGGLLCVSAQAGLLRALAGGLGKDGGSRRPPAPHALHTRAAVGRACGPGQAAWPGREPQTRPRWPPSGRVWPPCATVVPVPQTAGRRLPTAGTRLGGGRPGGQGWACCTPRLREAATGQLWTGGHPSVQQGTALSGC